MLGAKGLERTPLQGVGVLANFLTPPKMLSKPFDQKHLVSIICKCDLKIPISLTNLYLVSNTDHYNFVNMICKCDQILRYPWSMTWLTTLPLQRGFPPPAMTLSIQTVCDWWSFSCSHTSVGRRWTLSHTGRPCSLSRDPEQEWPHGITEGVNSQSSVTHFTNPLNCSTFCCHSTLRHHQLTKHSVKLGTIGAQGTNKYCFS